MQPAGPAAPRRGSTRGPARSLRGQGEPLTPLPPLAVGVLLDLPSHTSCPGDTVTQQEVGGALAPDALPLLVSCCPASVHCEARPVAQFHAQLLSPRGGRPRREQPECWGRCGAQPPGLHRGPRAVSSGPGRTPCPVESGGLAGRPRDLTEGPCGCHLRPQSGGPRSRSRPSVQTHSCCKGGVVGVSSGRSVDRGAGRRGCGAKMSVTAADALVQAAP